MSDELKVTTVRLSESVLRRVRREVEEGRFASVGHAVRVGLKAALTPAVVQIYNGDFDVPSGLPVIRVFGPVTAMVTDCAFWKYPGDEFMVAEDGARFSCVGVRIHGKEKEKDI